MLVKSIYPHLVLFLTTIQVLAPAYAQDQPKKSMDELMAKFEETAPERLQEYLKAAEKGEISSQIQAAYMYVEGKGIDQDYGKAAKWMREAANQGDADAQYRLGMFYYKGEVLERNPEEAAKWWRKAAAQGDVRAEFSLGQLYKNGKGVKRDELEATKWIQRATSHSDSSSQHALGTLYLYGSEIVEVDFREAKKWLQLSADQDHYQAKIFLNSVMYGFDTPEAIEWYHKLAGEGDVLAQFYLGDRYYNGEGGVPQDFENATKLYTSAAEQGHASSQEKLGQMFYLGEGVPQDYKEAVKWWTLAAEQGDVSSQTNLAQLYRDGKGVPQDNKEAVKWYTLAAEQGMAYAQLHLGIMYYNGDGVLQDYVQAHMWSNLSSANGNSSARENRDKISKLMTSEQIAEAQKLAQEWLEQHPPK